MKFCLTVLFLFLCHTTSFAEKLVIGTLAYSPPFEMIADTKRDFVGFDIELMDAVCKRIQATCEYKPMKFKYILEAVQLGGVDLAIAAITITTERQAYYLFSLPYLMGEGQVMTNSNSPVTDYKDLMGKRIGVEEGSLFQRIADDKFGKASVVTFQSQQDFFVALSNHTIDAVLCDGGSAQYWVDNNPGLYKLVGGRVHLGKGYAIVANLNRVGLIDRINKALVTMQNDGTYIDLYNRYWGLRSIDSTAIPQHF